jgi:CRP-like cAMP-binding protein
MDAGERQAVARFLDGGEWFGNLSSDLKELILARSVPRTFAKGEVISLEHSRPKGLFALIEGEVHLVRNLGDGEEVLVHVCEPGHWFAEYAVLAGKLTIVTFIAHTRVRALLLPKAQFDYIVGADPRHYQAFARLALDHFAALVELLSGVRGLAPELRVRSRLAFLARLRMQETREPEPVALSLAQVELARMVGLSRQTLNAILQKLHHAGLVDVGFRRIRIPDVARLETEGLGAGREPALIPQPSHRRAEVGVRSPSEPSH